MKYEREHMPECANEVDAFVKHYFETTIAGKDMDPLEFKWDMYRELDDRGRLLFIAARNELEENRLLGFVSYFMSEHLHHRQVLATCDMLAVHPEYRGIGMGSQLVGQAEQWLKAQGVTHIVHAYRLIYGDNPLFPKLGYKAEETWYVKDIR